MFSSFSVAGLQVVVFDAEVTTGDAYNLTQTSDGILDGAVLLVPREQVAGVMVEAWPIAVTAEHGQFHGFTERPTTEPHADAYERAVAVANALGWRLSTRERIAAGELGIGALLTEEQPRPVEPADRFECESPEAGWIDEQRDLAEERFNAALLEEE